MNSEFKRMMELAGLNEIKINRPITHVLVNSSKPNDVIIKGDKEKILNYITHDIISNTGYEILPNGAVVDEDDWEEEMFSNVQDFKKMIWNYLTNPEMEGFWLIDRTFLKAKKLGSINEIKINKPKRFLKLNLPFDSTNSNTLIPVDELDNNFADLVEDLIKLNPQIAAFLLNDDGIYNDVIDTLSTDYLDGATLKEFYKTYFYWVWIGLMVDSKYSNEEINARDKKYGHMREEFVNNALDGKWLAVDGVTA